MIKKVPDTPAKKMMIGKNHSLWLSAVEQGETWKQVLTLIKKSLTVVAIDLIVSSTILPESVKKEVLYRTILVITDYVKVS